MYTQELIPLFEDKEKTKESTHRIEDAENIALPQVVSDLSLVEQRTLIENALDKMFPEQQREDKTLRKAKEILGRLSEKLTLEQIQTIITEVQYLCDSWLDSYERKQFNGLTLNELLNNG